jgi:hypothetical protein
MPRSKWIIQGLTETSRVEAVRAELIARGVPRDLAAVPLVESGYRNLTPEANPVMNTAGLWQFIPQTATMYRLTIDGNVDERRDIDKSTDAALGAVLLASRKDQFFDRFHGGYKL